MNSLRSILVHQDAGRHSEGRLALARSIAAQYQARVTALFAVATRFVPIPLPLDGGGLPAAPLLDEVDPEHRRRARLRFEHAAAASGWPLQWSELGGEPLIAGFSRRALYADLLVLGQHDAQDPDAFDMPGDFVESVLLTSGRPAIIVPQRPTTRSDRFNTVLIAWLPNRETAQALAGALPLLQRASRIHLVTWSNDPGAVSQWQKDVLDHLRLHGVDGVHPHQGPAPGDAGTAVLSLAEEVGADLLVMGCYSHARARELVLGGTTRTVLRDMPLPVLMAH